MVRIQVDDYPADSHKPHGILVLTHQTNDYKPTQEHFKLFGDIKKEVSKMGAPPYFDVNAETTL